MTGVSAVTSDSTKQRLIEAAGAEFALHGYESATVRAICRRAGTNLAAVNYHFGDKSSLYRQAVLEAYRCGIPDEPEIDFSVMAPREALRGFIEQFLERVLALDLEKSWHHDLKLRELTRPTEACGAVVESMIRPRFQKLRAIIGSLVQDADERRLNALCFSVIGQCIFYRLARPIAERLIGEESLAAMDRAYLARHITCFTLGALGFSTGYDSTRRTESPR
jgi:AcrR family transcriptional regulator